MMINENKHEQRVKFSGTDRDTINMTITLALQEIHDGLHDFYRHIIWGIIILHIICTVPLNGSC